MTFQRAQQIQGATVPMVFGYAGPAGSGKTLSAIRQATGMAKPEEVFFIDTEGGRGLMYRAEYDFMYDRLEAPYTVERYRAAIEDAVKHGAKVVIVDSLTHEHSGPGGILEQAETILNRMAGDDYAKRERAQSAAWARVKPARNQFINFLMSLPVITILCFQARPKSKPGKDRNGKFTMIDMGFQPDCGTEYPFALTTFAMFDSAKPGVPEFNREGKPLMDQIKHCFPEGQQVTEETGKLLMEWLNCTKQQSAPGQTTPPPNASTQPPEPPQDEGHMPELRKLCDDMKTAESIVQLEAMWNAATQAGVIDWTREHMPDALKWAEGRYEQVHALLNDPEPEQQDSGEAA